MTYKNETITNVMCPLIDENIEAIECIVNRDCVDGMLVLSLLPKKFKTKDNFMQICRNCKWHNY